MGGKQKTIGIIGGMGPLATVDLMEKIIRMTKADRDQQHIPMVVDSNTAIPDRTAAILSGGPSPLPQLVRSAVRLEAMGADVLMMACNTAHWFYNDMLPFVKTPILHMIRETALACRDSGHRAVGLLATEGTCRSGIYASALTDAGVEAIAPTARQQEAVTALIYDGIKAGKATFDTAAVKGVLEELKSRGAETFILGCTELPLAFQQYGIEADTIDPTVVLARRAIVEAGYELAE